MAGPIYRVTYCFENLFGGKLRLKWTNRKGEGGEQMFRVHSSVTGCAPLRTVSGKF